MLDKKKIIKGLEFCFSEDDGCVKCNGCSYENERVFGYACPLGKDVLELLKEQETKTGTWYLKGDPSMYVVECSECGQRYLNYAIQPLANYCSMCGAKMESVQYNNNIERSSNVDD